MSKSNNLKPFLSVAVSLALFASMFTSSVAWGQNPQERSTDIHMRIQLATGGWLDVVWSVPIDYYNGWAERGTTWSNTNLVTSKHDPLNNPRYLSHIRVGSLAYPNSITVSRHGLIFFLDNAAIMAAVDEYWDYHVYGSYEKTWDPATTYGADPSKNCHGYSTGKGVWLDDFEVLMQDDYLDLSRAQYLIPGAIIGDNRHSIKINEVCSALSPFSFKIVSISEKYRDSGIYKKVINQTFFWNDPVRLHNPPNAVLPTAAGYQGFYRHRPN